MIHVRRLSVSTPEGKTILDDLSFQVPPGRVLGVYGPNGSGKSTAMRTLSGMELGHRVFGEIQLERVPLELLRDPKDRVNRILYLGSDFHAPFHLTVRELFEMAAEVGGGRERIAGVIESVGIISFLARDFRTLSDGEKQLMMFARALIQAPKALVLDETFSKLDLDKLLLVASVIRKWRESGMTFLIASHDLNFLSEVSDELLFMKAGKSIGQGVVEEMLVPSKMDELFPGVPLQVVKSPESGNRKILY